MDTSSAPPSDLRIDRATATGTPGVLCLAVSGEVDMVTGGSFQETLQQALDEPGLRRLLLDCASLRFLDSNGVTILLRTLRAAQERGIAFGIVDAAATIACLLEMLGVAELLTAGEPGR